MNIVTYSPQYILYFLQQQNIRKKTEKTIEMPVEKELPFESPTIIKEESQVIESQSI
jgi:hypothetical protein